MNTKVDLLNDTLKQAQHLAEASNNDPAISPLKADHAAAQAVLSWVNFFVRPRMEIF